MEIRIETFSTRSKKLRDEIRRKETELNTARTNLENFVREANTKYNLAHTEHLNEKDDLNDTINRLKKLNQDVRDDLSKERKALAIQKMKFAEELRECERRSKQDEIGRVALETKNDSLSKLVTELENRIVGLQKDQGAQYIKLSAELEVCRRDAKDQANKADIKLNETQQEAQRNFNQLRQTEAFLADLKEQFEKYKITQTQKLAKIEKEHENKTSCLQQIHQDTLQATNEINRKAFDKEISLRKKRVADLNEQLDELRAELAKKSVELKDTQNVVKDLESDLKATLKKLEASMSDVEDLRQISKNVGSTQLETKAALERQRIRADKAELHASALKTSTDKQIASLSDELKEAHMRIEELDLRSKGQNKEIQELTKACKDQLAEANSKHSEKVKNLKNSHVMSLDELTQKLNQNMSSLKKKHQEEIEALVVSHKKALSEVEAKKEDLLKNSQSSSDKLVTRIRDLERNLKIEKERLSKVEKEKERLTKELEVSKFNFDKMSRARKKLEIEIQSTTGDWAKKRKRTCLSAFELFGLLH
eukprot:TRINITY_DN1006_c0_g2_i2.p1 TRINITY_DN1006_c0_g2~~TRINITY_DN1006_c0_g2_i2.p1  ORF type:complete len:538 (-),score=143.25 TRINITY_DN1006_c0_g2_i2:85-1698(-)